MPPFRTLSDLELDRMSDDELVAHIAEARRRGEHGQARLALQILVYGHIADLERRARAKLPEHAVDEVVGEAFYGALRSALDGTSVGEFRNWLNTILDRRIVDHLRRKRLRTQPLDPGGAGDDDARPPIEPPTPDAVGAVELRLVVDRVLDALRPAHRQVIGLYVFGDLPAREVADRVNDDPAEPLDTPMSENNVHQIAGRFRADLRSELGDADTS